MENFDRETSRKVHTLRKWSLEENIKLYYTEIHFEARKG
jgi:hypothetical protein